MRIRHLLWLGLVGALVGVLIPAAEWPSSTGNPQRDGWSRGEKGLSKETLAAKKFELLFQYKFENRARGLNAMTQPIVLGNLIGYLGFKELIFIGGSGDAVYALDAD